MTTESQGWPLRTKEVLHGRYRNSHLQTTREIYIKGFDGDAVAAMKRLEVVIQSRPN